MYRAILTTPAEKEYDHRKRMKAVEAEILDRLGEERENEELETAFNMMLRHGE